LKLVDICQKQGVAITGYSPLGNPGRPGATANDPILVEDPKIITMAQKHDKTPAQICLRWQVRNDFYSHWPIQVRSLRTSAKQE